MARGGSTSDGPEATVVLLSDGATTVGRPALAAAADAAEAGVPVSTIAYGTDTGTVVVQGEVVPVPADVATMAEVADLTGGSAFEAESAGELEAVYDDIQGRVGFTMEQREIERLFLGLGLAGVVAAVGAALLWRPGFV